MAAIVSRSITSAYWRFGPLCGALLVVASKTPAAPMPGTFDLDDLDGKTGFAINGELPDDFSGNSVSGKGDINGDGVTDLIIGAYGADPNGTNRAGIAYVLFGGDQLNTTVRLDLSSLDGSNGFSIIGKSANDFAGWSVGISGDLNDDGFDDILIGAPNADPNSNTSAGETYVIFGDTNSGSSGTLQLSDLNGNNGFTLTGFEELARTGHSIAFGGDLNGDGIDDMAIGASSASPDGNRSAGQVYIVFGDSEVGSSGIFSLADLDGNNGFLVSGLNIDDRLGQSVSFAGDIDNDGLDDLIIGAPGFDPSGKLDAGASFVLFGNSTIGNSGEVSLASLTGGNGFALNGVDPLDRSGQAVSAAGDVNGDNIADIIVGADRADPNAAVLSGESYVIFGSNSIGSGGEFELSSLNGSNGFTIQGTDATNGTGVSVTGTGDVNGDGVDDILIGAHGATANASEYTGKSHLIFGGSFVGMDGDLSVSQLNGVNGLSFHGVSPADFSGRYVSAAGDINNDGVADLAIAAIGADPDSKTRAGQTYLVYMPLPDTAEPNDIQSNATAITEGESQSHSLAPLGDIDRFSFSLAQASTVEITLSDDGTAVNYDTVLELFDNTGTSLASDSSSIGAKWSQLSMSLDTGVYQFQVSSLFTDLVVPSYSVTFISTPTNTGLTCQGLLVTVNIGDGDSPTAGDDVILGTPDDDVIVARGGNDIICGEGGDDTISGGSGDDLIDAGEGADIVNGGGGPDTIYGQSGADILRGGSGNDSLMGGSGDDQILGGAGDDLLQGGDGNDSINGQTGDDTIEGEGGIDILVGADGNDMILTGPGSTTGTANFASGGDGDDNIIGGPDSDFILGGNGADDIRGNEGDDDLRGDNGADIMYGDDGDDFLSGGADDDSLYGGTGKDTLLGQGGMDTLFGGSRADILKGGPDNDNLDGNSGNDELRGNAGDDTLEGSFGKDVLLGGPGNDELSGGPGIDSCNGQSGVDSADADCEVQIGLP